MKFGTGTVMTHECKLTCMSLCQTYNSISTELTCLVKVVIVIIITAAACTPQYTDCLHLVIILALLHTINVILSVGQTDISHAVRLFSVWTQPS